MITNPIKPRKALNKAYLKVKPYRENIEVFKKNLIKILDFADDSESEEYHKNLVSGFLKDSLYYNNYFINTSGRSDQVIHVGPKPDSAVGVIVEAKNANNKSEMVSVDNLNKKAFHELLLYFLRERITKGNLEVKNLIITNLYEWFIFDANSFEKGFVVNKGFVKRFKDFEAGNLSGTSTDFFYNEIAKPFLTEFEGSFSFVHFDLRKYEKIVRNDNSKDDQRLVSLFKVLSPEHLLKLPFENDSNSLDKKFYTELLHIIGLTEVKKGSKKLIQRNEKDQRNLGSLLENTILQLDSRDKISRLPNPRLYGENKSDQLFNVGLELVITWVNRILFLKLLEAQLIRYHKDDNKYAFLNLEKIKDYDDLDNLFFQVLAKKHVERNQEAKTLFGLVPYLNSSLFEPTDIEHDTIFLSNLRDDKPIPIISSTVLKNENGKRRSGQLSTLEYLFAFLDAYDFSSEGAEDIQEDNKTLINASVLGLIFEKINGYKDGSFFTPGFITMYMCRETIRKAVVQKFNVVKNWNCKDLDEIYDKIEDRNEANSIINSIKICDPAVGSGHFLVSALNELIAIKNDLRIFQDVDGKRLKEYEVEVVNDELVITDDEDELFEYHPNNKESQRVQMALFHEKQTLIENCLFGVDINPNSVKICRLRLWIELLKNAYYKGENELETLPNIDINIKSGNSLISRFALDDDLKDAFKDKKIEYSFLDYKQAVANYKNTASKEKKREILKIINEVKNNFKSTLDNKFIAKFQKAQGLAINEQERHNNLKAFDQRITKTDKEKLKKLQQKAERALLEKEEIVNNIIYENAFEWRFEFPEILSDEGDYLGFDVVIGNPPWGANIPQKELKFIKNINNEIIVRMIDTFMFFINLSFNIKSENGLVCQIIPDVILYQIDNYRLREKILKESQLLLVVNLGDQIFDDVSRPSCIIQFGNPSLEDVILTLEYSVNNNIDLPDITPTKVNSSLYNSLPNKLFATRNIDGYKILKRLDDSTLSKLIDDHGIQRGVSPDLKEAFIIELNHSELNSFENDYIKPTITGGRDVEKYFAKDVGKRVIYTKKSDDPANIENLIKYLSSFKDKITCKEVQQGKHPFWSLHRSRDQAIFEKEEKIVGVITGDKVSLSLDRNQLYPTDGLYVFATNGKYSNIFLIGLLNSKLITYLYRLISMEKGRTLAQIKPSVLQNLPVSSNFETSLVSQIENKTSQIIEQIESKGSKAYDTLVEEIDQMVYQLYELTEEEIEIVANA